jgi:membrane-bound metal-dependent hydrolase YbcI (DUF457 family)
MPTPIGHALAGLAIACAAPRRSNRLRGRESIPWTLLLLCATLAALPDLDLLYQPIHRTVTHSITSAVFVTIIAVLVTRWVTLRGQIGVRPRSDPRWVGLLCGAAWGSHILLDWMGTDFNAPRGIQALWPFSDRWFISGWDLFPRVERRQPLSSATMLSNVKAIAYEIAIVGPIAVVLWWTRIRR